jgi:hypothetical protein
MQRLRLRLYLHGLTDRLDATEAELRAALEGVPNVTHYAVLYPLVLNDGIWAALHVLGDVEMVTSD